VIASGKETALCARLAHEAAISQLFTFRDPEED
jgi:hypothetical protein